MIDLTPFDQALILTGPTASGKSALACSLAERLNGEIISMDSMAVYRGMDIGTAKPSLQERQRIPHHLVDCHDPWEGSSVAWWLKESARITAEILRRGRVPIIAGGTPLYLKALLHGIFDGPEVDSRLRVELEQLTAEELQQRLQPLDPQAASRIHLNDRKRLVRALEVCLSTGKPFSLSLRQFDTLPRRGSAPVFCMTLPRDVLYQRINNRVDAMMQAGWLEEVRRLTLTNFPLSREAAQAAGYRELLLYLQGGGSLQEAVEATKTRSRQLAKRQLTWFRSIPGLHSLNALEPLDKLADYVSSMTAAIGSTGPPL